VWALIYKSQGSEFPIMVIPLAMQQYLLLQRNLVYTGITLGKKLMVFIGQRRAIGMAVKNNRTEQRFSELLTRLKAAPGQDAPVTVAIGHCRLATMSGAWSRPGARIMK
jgi:hypothetical protein